MSEEQIILAGPRWDYPQMLLSDQPCTGNFPVVTLDASIRSDLVWSDAIAQAERLMADQTHFLWRLDFGLFDRLGFDLENQSQFLTLSLAVKHFYEAIGDRFDGYALGVVIYKGDLSLPPSSCSDDRFDEWRGVRFPDDDAPAELQLRMLHRRDVAIDYLQLLASYFSEDTPLFAMVDVAQVSDPIVSMLQLDRERWEGITPVVRGAPFWEAAVWDQDDIICFTDPDDAPAVALMIPNSESTSGVALEQLRLPAQALEAYRVVPEEYLITEWSGLDRLIVASSGVAPMGLRRLQGFCAAGGTVVTIGDSLSLAVEECGNKIFEKKGLPADT
jgi:hypothetical protein